jgi:hypothetical protein
VCRESRGAGGGVLFGRTRWENGGKRELCLKAEVCVVVEFIVLLPGVGLEKIDIYLEFSFTTPS